MFIPRNFRHGIFYTCTLLIINYHHPIIKVLFALFVSSSLIGSCVFGMVVLRVILKEGSRGGGLLGLLGRPINMMILLDSLVLTVSFGWGASSYLVGTLSNLPLAQLFGGGLDFCTINMMNVCLGKAIRWVGKWRQQKKI